LQHAYLIGANRMALISRTRKPVVGTDILSTNLRDFLEFILKL
jgi:hypothetical protein